jgi:hypothetical protein
MQSYFKEMHARQEVVNSPHSNMTNKISKNNKGNPRRQLYDPFGGFLPVTYNLTTQRNMLDDPQFVELLERFELDKAAIWICKPGENANRGRGIVVLKDLVEVRKMLQNSRAD